MLFLMLNIYETQVKKKISKLSGKCSIKNGALLCKIKTSCSINGSEFSGLLMATLMLLTLLAPFNRMGSRGGIRFLINKKNIYIYKISLKKKKTARKENYLSHVSDIAKT